MNAIRETPALIPIKVKGCTLLLTPAEYAAAVKRGKAVRRSEALAKRTGARQ